MLVFGQHIEGQKLHRIWKEGRDLEKVEELGEVVDGVLRDDASLVEYVKGLVVDLEPPHVVSVEGLDGAGREASLEDLELPEDLLIVESAEEVGSAVGVGGYLELTEGDILSGGEIGIGDDLNNLAFLLDNIE